jgi:transcriptional regulator with XRE-family HTH domain
MIKNKRLEERRSGISPDVDLAVRQSFDIVDRIHEILVRQGKGRKDLARLLGKSESEISKWMSGSHNFTIQTLAKIQIALGELVVEVTKEKQVKETVDSFK